MNDTKSSQGKLREAMEASLPAVARKDKDDNDLSEESSLARNHAKAALDGIREDNRNKKANRRLRWRYAKWIFRYLVFYSAFTAAIVILHGFKIFGFQLPDIALGAVVGSTAVAAIGLVASVVSGLFKS